MRQVVRSPMGLTGMAIVATVVVLAIVGPPLWGEQAAQTQPGSILQGASAEHPLGTDSLGRDILYRVLVAARLSLGLALLATLIGAVLGIPLGSLPVMLPGRAGRTAASVVHTLVAFPGLLLALFTTTVIGIGATGAVLGIGVATAPVLGRLTHTLGASVAGSDYVAAAKVLGVGRTKIFVRHVLPNIAEPLILNLTMVLGSAFIALAGLSFLGLGVQPPAYDWGRLLFDGLTRAYVHPEVALGPAAAIALAGIGFNLLGESFARAASRETMTRPVPAPRDEVDVAGALDDKPGGVLDVRDLTVTFPGGVVPVRGISLSAEAGEILGVVGESGSGKSLTAMAIGQLVPHPGRVHAARLALRGVDLDRLLAAERRRFLGTGMAMVFQDPMTSLNPAIRIGAQLAEVSRVHHGMGRRESHDRAVERLQRVHIPEPERRARQYPHEFSGGMRQRAVIAMGLMGEPALVIADEPTTALDVTVQRQVLDLLQEMTASTRAALILISHDISVVADLSHRVLVMYAGQIVEDVRAEELVTGSAHPYTRALIAAVPDMSTDRDKPLATIPGRMPSPDEVDIGCAFAPRCPYASAICREERPPVVETPAGRLACWHPVDA